MKKIIILVSKIVLLFLILPVLVRVSLIFQEPTKAYEDFLDTTDQAEDMLIDPLILALELLS